MEKFEYDEIADKLCTNGIYLVFSKYLEEYMVGRIVPDIWEHKEYTKEFNPTDMFKFGIEYGLLLAGAIIYENKLDEAVKESISDKED